MNALSRPAQIRLLKDVMACTRCSDHLPHRPRPVIQWHPSARILIAGQAPGRRVHETGVPFSDPSGDRLREWLGMSEEEFYDSHRVAIMPMGFCYPGTGKSGDLPPRPECAPAWREALLSQLQELKLSLLIGTYAQDYHFGDRMSVTERVLSWRDYWPDLVPMPHPSPRNNRWLRSNPWFETELLPALRSRVRQALEPARE